MPQQLTTTTENNFTKGLITEATGLNFPENAATDTDNCIYTLIGDVTRREGINYEPNYITTFYDRYATPSGINSYKWNNVGGDGETQMVVVQRGDLLYFYTSSNATVSNPLSNQILAGQINLRNFLANTTIFDITNECQFADGNGYLFVFHPNCDSFYCSYTSGVVTGTIIKLQIRDFVGVDEANVPVNFRPPALSQEHLYNISNQGWTQGNAWGATATGFSPNVVNTGNITLTVASGITGIVAGQSVNIINNIPLAPGVGNPIIPAGTVIMSGNVVSYTSTNLVIDVSSYLSEMFLNGMSGTANVVPSNVGFINTWFSDLGNYPSNADVWWYFKDNTNTYNPTTTVSNVNLNLGQAPQGHFLLSAFIQQRSLVSSISGITDIFTSVRPRTGAWFQGRVFYTGVDAQWIASGDSSYYTWTENIYFSQIVIDATDFGNCYQTNDPTSQDAFDLLPTDGGVIQIQGAGSIYKLFPIQNGMLVFAANGVWFITGSQGIGFSANDYTITKISAVQAISSTSFVDVMGLPYFWNAEGIYSVTPSQGGGLAVNPITVGTILTFYNNIPYDSRRYVRGAYDPINYIIQWVYKSTQETSVSDRYAYDGVLSYNTYNKAFYPYTIDNSFYSINGIVYVTSPGGANAVPPSLMYLASGDGLNTFAYEYDDSYVDWDNLPSGTFNYNSYFITGYKIRGQGIKKFQPQYIQVYSRQNGAASFYKIQGIWDYANDPNSGRWSTIQMVTNGLTRYDTVSRRHKIRGHGFALQFKIMSVDGQPFDIQGWATVDTMNTGT